MSRVQARSTQRRAGGSVRLTFVAVLVAALLSAGAARADETSYGAFLGPQLLFDVDTYTSWGGGIDVVFGGVMYFKFELAFADFLWDTDFAGGFNLPVYQNKWIVLPVRLGALFKFLYHMAGSEKPDGTLFPKDVANTEGVGALGAEAGAALELKLGKRKKDSPRAFIGVDFQVFNGVEYLSTHDVGWLTALNIVAGMRFF